VQPVRIMSVKSRKMSMKMNSELEQIESVVTWFDGKGMLWRAMKCVKII